MNIPDDLKYTKEHEWVKVEGKIATIGASDHAQEQLGDIVYVELPTVGETLSADGAFGVLESVKAVSDCYSPVSGKVVEINDTLTDSPETINDDPYGEGWIVKIEMDNLTQLNTLMDHIAYKAYLAEETA